MSTLRVEIVRIKEILPIENAHSLEMAVVEGWQVVVGKGQYKVDDLAVYFPIDSILSENTERLLFSPDSKIKLNRRRVKTVKIRGVISQGLLGSLKDLGIDAVESGIDVAEILGITKYEPPEPEYQKIGPKAKKRSKPINPNFQKFTDIENVKWWPNLFASGEQVVITEKIHGTNFRAGWVKVDANSVWKKIKKFFGKLPPYEFVYGSRNVHFTGSYKGYYAMNFYKEMVDKYDLRTELKPGEVIYGEIYGSSIQKGYTYGCANDERKLVVFDVMVNNAYSDSEFVTWFCDQTDLPRCPVLYEGPFDPAKLAELTSGKSVLAPEQIVREGCVIRSEENTGLSGRKILKSINPEYLLKDQTEFH